MKGYTLDKLPLVAQKALLRSHQLKNVAEYRGYLEAKKAQEKATQEASSGVGLFGAGLTLGETKPLKTVEPKLVRDGGIIWATDSYDGHGVNFDTPVARELVQHIVPRSEKAKAEQKKRTKDKAEVFTPSWVCNLQNNLVDDEVLYEGAFNRSDNVSKSWTVNPEPIDFSKAKARKDDPNYSWVHYVMSQRLEITCGEGPYLMSRYDTVTGAEIPVRDSEGNFQRIGLLDRKFRVIAENVKPEDHETWLGAARLALLATYGYEWQGDNLLLARLSFLNTFVDYYIDFIGGKVPEDILTEVADLASWQLWQMDGLKMVTPMSCSENCKSCEKKLRTDHDGNLPLIHWGERLVIFEEFLS